MSDEHDDKCPHCAEDISEVIHGLKSALAVARPNARHWEAFVKQKKEDGGGQSDKALLAVKVSELSAELEVAADKLKDADTEVAEQLRTELETLRASTVSKSEFDALTTELETSTASISKLKDDATQGKIATAVAAAGGNFPMLSPMIKAAIAANPNLDIDAHLKTLRADSDFGGAFKGSDHSSGGAQPGRDTLTLKNAQAGNLRQSTMSMKERNEYQKEHGLDALLNLPA